MHTQSDLQSSRKQTFISDHSKFLRNLWSQAEDKRRLFLGFSNFSSKEAFDAVFLQGDVYYLPLCFFLTYFGFGVPQDEEFAISGLRTLSIDEHSQIMCPYSAYLYAFCLRSENKVDKSEDVLSKLRELGFMPSFCAYGDLHFIKGDKTTALKHYVFAAEKGHVYSRRRLTQLKHEKSVIFKCVKPFKYLSAMISLLLLKNNGEKCLYLDFYGVSKKG